MFGFTELAASARARKTASFIAAHRREFAEELERATGPLKQRIVELEGLLANAVENGDRLANDLAKAEAKAEALEAKAKALEERAAKAEAKAQKVAPKRGK